MAGINLIQTNFTAGAISPKLWGHVDIARYKNALKAADNAVCLPHGPVKRRNGFEYINEIKNSANGVRLLRFQFDQTNAYIIELGPNYMRFYKNGAVILSGGVPYEVAHSWGANDIWGITYFQFGRVIYLFSSASTPVKLTWTSDTSWSLTSAVFYPVPTTELGVKPTTTLTPGATSGTGINFTAGAATTFRTADVGRQLKNLSGTGIAVITAYTNATTVVCDILENFPNTNPIASQSWLLDLSVLCSITMSGSRIGSQVTATSGTALTWRGSASTSNDTGRYLIIHNGVGKIKSFSSDAIAVVEIQKGLSAVSATENFTVEDPVWTTNLGFPKVGTLHQQRLWAAATTTYPSRVWASESGLFDSMGTGTNDSDGLDIDLTNKEISSVSWMASIRNQLVIGTNSSEMTLDSGTQNGPITSANIVQQVRSYHGSNLQQPIGMDDAILYIQKSGQKINAFRYDFQLDNYVSEDLLFMSDHLVNGTTIKEICYAQDPDRQLYAVLNSGELLACTYIREQEVLAWTRLITDGEFEAINTISTGIHDEVWVVVKRTINGSTKRYIERLDHSDGSSNLDGFSDSYLTYSEPKTIVSTSDTSPPRIEVTAHGLSAGDKIKIFETEWSNNHNPNNLTYTVAAVINANVVSLHDSSNNDTLDETLWANAEYTANSGTMHKLVTTISGLDHLEGQDVEIKTDGGVHESKTVASGSITLNSPHYEVTVGLPYETVIETLPKEFNAEDGSHQGHPIRWVKPALRLYQSVLPLVDGEYSAARDANDHMDAAIDLFSGDYILGSLTWKDGFSSGLRITINKPLPFMLLGIFGSTEMGTL